MFCTQHLLPVQQPDIGHVGVTDVCDIYHTAQTMMESEARCVPHNRSLTNNVWSSGHTRIWTCMHTHAGARTVSCWSCLVILLTDKVRFEGVFKATLQHTVARNLTHICAAQLPHLCCHAVLLHKRFLMGWQSRFNSRHSQGSQDSQHSQHHCQRPATSPTTTQTHDVNTEVTWYTYASVMQDQRVVGGQGHV